MLAHKSILSFSISAVLLFSALAAQPVVAAASPAPQPGNQCFQLGETQIAADRANLVACLLVNGNASAQDCAAGGGCLWKPMTPVFMDNASNIGVGTPLPKAKLDVIGGVKVGNDAAKCTADKAGTIKWSGTEMWYCNNSGQWKSFTPASQMSVGGVDIVIQESTGIFGYCRLAWGAVTSCSGAGVVCSVGSPMLTTASYDIISSGEDTSPGKFVSSGAGGAHIAHFDCILTLK